MNIFTVLILRLVAFALVTYAGMSLEWAVLLTSDPDLVGALNVGVSAAVVMLSEMIALRFGRPASVLVRSVAERYAKKYADKVVIEKPKPGPK